MHCMIISKANVHWFVGTGYLLALDRQEQDKSSDIEQQPPSATAK